MIPQKQLMLKNGCLGSSHVDACQAVQDGVFSKGLHAVLQLFVTTTEDIISLRAATASYPGIQVHRPVTVTV